MALALAALILFTANTSDQALPALDDCFYARKSVEMGRRGFSFTVTLGGVPTFQNPPGQFWLVGAAFRLLGENDFVARLPSALMAVGILLATWRIGHLTIGGPVPLVAVALLLLSPAFANNARRCMMEIPLTFWTVVAILSFLEGLTRRWWLAVFAFGLGAAILTKSLLGLLPLFVIAGGTLFVPAWQAAVRSPWPWLAALAGLLLGGTWTVDQVTHFGGSFLHAHYGAEILERASQPTGYADAVFAYPKILLQSFQPVVLPAIVGAGMILRDSRVRRTPAVLAALWAFAPVVAYSASSAHSARYVFPVFPALALCAAAALIRFTPRLAVVAPTVATSVALLGAVIFWTSPSLLSRPGTSPFKDNARVLSSAIPPDERVPYIGSRFWSHANPLLYYASRHLEPADSSLVEALAMVQARPSRLVLVDRERLRDVLARAPGAEGVVEAPTWTLLRLQSRNLGRDARGGLR